MKSLFLLCLAAVIATSFGAATPEDVTTGPFKISFDMDLPKESYNITVDLPKEERSSSGEMRTKYAIELKNKMKDKTGLTRFADISIRDYQEEQRIATTDEYVAILKDPAKKDPDVKVRLGTVTAIDGTTGTVMPVELAGTKWYSITYHPSFDPNHVTVTIISGFPWEEGTLQLLNTIHIERI